MKFLKFLLLGVFFGIVMVKSEAVSWFRIQEMFRFQSFHMYGIIGSALFCGIAIIQWIKRGQVKSYDGHEISLTNKLLRTKANLFGGIIFGFGWAFTGACPGPMFTLIGTGAAIFILVLISAIFGTFMYGVLQRYLPE